MSRYLLLPLALLLCAPVAAQMPDAPAGDPANRETVIDFGAPEALVIETEDGELPFSVLIADEDDERSRGLMFREALADDEGMLFNYVTPQPIAMWMRNTEISLDIIYIYSDGEIAKIVANAQPFSLRSLPSDFPVLAALEVRGGLSRDAGIRPGDIVRHAIFNNLDSGDAPAENPAEITGDLDDGETPEPGADAN